MADTRPSAADVSITACPNGPLLVRGNVRLTAPDGTPIPRTRATLALCRCGKSGRAPLCDGTHKAIGFTTD
jgi:CDGSH-type Zn-finger protein